MGAGFSVRALPSAVAAFPAGAPSHTQTADSPVISYAGPFSAPSSPIKAMIGFGLHAADSPHILLLLLHSQPLRALCLTCHLVNSPRHAFKSVAFSPKRRKSKGQTRPPESVRPSAQASKQNKGESRRSIMCKEEWYAAFRALPSLRTINHAMILTHPPVIPPPPPLAMGTSTEVAGYICSKFFFRRARIYLTSPPHWAPSLARVNSFVRANSITFGYTGPGIEPIAGRQTVSTAWRTNTRRPERADVVGYAVPSLPPSFLFSFRGAILSF